MLMLLLSRMLMSASAFCFCVSVVRTEVGFRNVKVVDKTRIRRMFIDAFFVFNT